MNRELDVTKVRQAMEKTGLSQTAVARALDVSKEAVSGWLKGRNFPRPNKLLQLGKLLNLSFDAMVITEEPNAPRVAFRKVRGTKTKDHHIKRAQEMGRFLRQLVNYLPFDTLKMPPVLKSPSCDYDYIRAVTEQVREEIKLGPNDILDFNHLISFFNELQAVIVPVLWGARQRHENAIHIYLPDSHSTWVYLNLDTNHHDFKFWMAHELGHCLSPSLEGDEAEDFADAFAGTLLFPHYLAKHAYNQLMNIPSIRLRTTNVLEWANKFTISPFTIVKQVEKYATANNQPQPDLGARFGASVTNFNKRYKNLSDALFHKAEQDDHGRPCSSSYIKLANDSFASPFFDLLGQYLIEHDKGPGFIQTVLDMPPLDAISLHAELTHGPVKDTR